MDQRELDARIKALQKAINEKDPAADIIKIMETLKNEVNPTEELLRVCSLVACIPRDCMRIAKMLQCD